MPVRAIINLKLQVGKSDGYSRKQIINDFDSVELPQDKGCSENCPIGSETLKRCSREQGL